MNETDRMYGAIGFAQKAGKCVSGSFAVEKAVKSGKARLVLLDESASENAKEKYQSLCKQAGIACLQVEDIGRAIGKDERISAAIVDAGFATRIANLHGSIVGWQK